MSASSEAAAAAPRLLPDFLAGHVSCVVSKIGQAVARLLDGELEALGIRTRHYQVLKTLLAEGARSQQAVGELLRIDPATMVTTIDDLEGLGYVERRRNASDRRAYAISVTPEGRAALAAADAVVDRVDRRLLEGFAPGERRRLDRDLRRLARSVGLRRLADDLPGR